LITHREHNVQALTGTTERSQCKIKIAVQAADGSGLICSKFRIPLQFVPMSFAGCRVRTGTSNQEKIQMAKIAKTADRKKVMDTSKSTDCPKCGKATRIVKRVKDRERNIPGGIYISCSACEFYEKL
jgi:DNA-directed RNA polymerase subunit M/transcription elongation factor TFIIS